MAKLSVDDNKKEIWRVVVLIIWTLGLFGMLLIPIEPSLPLRDGFRHWDKVAHIGLFAITSFVYVLGARFLNSIKSRILFGIIFSLFLALATECAQYFIVSRSADLYDFIADLVGLLVGIALYLLLYSSLVTRRYLRL